jgi:hypothetical protein
VAGAGGHSSGVRLDWTELRAIPQRSGILELELSTDPGIVPVGLDPHKPLGLTLEGTPPRFEVEGRWGEPVDLLVEGDEGPPPTTKVDFGTGLEQ